MTRVLALLVFGALVAALLLAPSPSQARLAAAEAGKVLREPVVGGGEDADSLWKTIRGTEHFEVRAAPEGSSREVLHVRLGGTRFETDGDETGDPLWHGVARGSLIREMRAQAEDEGFDLEVEGLKWPVPDGLNFLVERKGDGITVTAHGTLEVGELEDAPRAVRRWVPIDQLSLLPPLVAIFLAILTRRPVLSLLFGVLSGAALVRWYLTGALGATLGGAFTGGGGYLWSQVVDRARAEIVLFVVFMLAMVGVITRAGGIRGVMNRISALARDARRTQVATWLMGLVVFFDDYANTILVGSTMRPLSDRFKVAREKLAYIVDSTAAPVAGISILSTWIAFEVSTFSPSLPDAELAPTQGYAVFIETLPYRFYCLFTLFFVGLLVLTGRDYGPMLRAERRARAGAVLRPGATPMVGKAATELESSEHVTPAASTALVPLVTFVAVVVGTILYSGGAFSGDVDLLSVRGATQILYAGSGETPLMVGAIAGFVVALAFAVRVRLPVGQSLRAAFAALRSMGVALAILYLAWSLGRVCEDLGTATYLAVSLGQRLPWMLLPVALFLLSGMVAFSTGSSWGTMTILLPLVVGLAYQLGFDSVDAIAGLEAQRAAGHLLLVISIGAVLEGAIFGDHCSPISDTTVMSSIASASDHIDHVRTQAPYALTTMAVALVVGYFPAAFLGLSPWISLAAGAAVLFVVVRMYGRRADGSEGGSAAA